MVVCIVTTTPILFAKTRLCNVWLYDAKQVKYDIRTELQADGLAIGAKRNSVGVQLLFLLHYIWCYFYMSWPSSLNFFGFIFSFLFGNFVCSLCNAIVHSVTVCQLVYAYGGLCIGWANRMSTNKSAHRLFSRIENSTIHALSAFSFIFTIVSLYRKCDRYAFWTIQTCVCIRFLFPTIHFFFGQIVRRSEKIIW